MSPTLASCSVAPSSARPHLKGFAAALLALALAGCSSTGAGATPVYFDIGAVHRDATTESPEAALWFDRGLGLTYGFNHEEAIRCFERALEADPGFAMAAWGKAYALGPNYNSPLMTDEASQAAYESLQQALASIERCTPVERDLIDALRARYAWPAPADRSALDAAYADAMRRVAAAHPGDADVQALAAEALMQLRPWKLWSHEGVPAPEVAAIRGVLEPALARWPRHPALCHLYIHAMEASPEVARAIPVAETLETLTPGVGHLVHMPSHIYIWTGRYADSIRVNLAAIEADEAYVDYAGRDNFYTGYRVHNYHFVAYSAMWDGQRDLALRHARTLVEEMPAELVATYPDVFDSFVATPYHVLVRFGMWDEMLAEPEPAEHLLAARAVWRYARGVALAALGRVDEARAEEVAFTAAAAAVPPTRTLFQNQMAQILGVAAKVLAGEIEYRSGNHERAFELLREAVALDERLNYDEPWGWMEPARHPLGALLTEQGRFAEAAEVYRQDLARYPENGWALHGLAECLRGLGRSAEAAEVEARFAKAWARSDVTIPGSCYCRVASRS